MHTQLVAQEAVWLDGKMPSFASGKMGDEASPLLEPSPALSHPVSVRDAGGEPMGNPEAYGEYFADRYDDLYGPPPEAAVAFLAERAGPGGRALELGIGTGRVALPLEARGVAVYGIDVSKAMLAKLGAKPGGGRIPVTVGDFSTLDAVAGAPFQLIYCVFSTLFVLTTQDRQVSCFRAVASKLAPGGAFVLEAFVPDPGRFSQRQPVLVRSVEDEGMTIEGCDHDTYLQLVKSRIVTLSPAGVKVLPLEFRYVWPSELDLMADLAGLKRVARWADWDRRPPGPGDGMQISVYEKPA